MPISLPHDSNNYPVHLSPGTTALAVTVDTSVSGSTEITLNAKTTLLRVYAKSQDVYMKWGTADVTASNFDEIIPAGQICDFIVPIETQPSTLYTAANFIEQAASASLTVIEK